MRVQVSASLIYAGISLREKSSSLRIWDTRPKRYRLSGDIGLAAVTRPLPGMAQRRVLWYFSTSSVPVLLDCYILLKKIRRLPSLFWRDASGVGLLYGSLICNYQKWYLVSCQSFQMPFPYTSLVHLVHITSLIIWFTDSISWSV